MLGALPKLIPLTPQEKLFDRRMLSLQEVTELLEVTLLEGGRPDPHPDLSRPQSSRSWRPSHLLLLSLLQTAFQYGDITLILWGDAVR